MAAINPEQIQGLAEAIGELRMLDIQQRRICPFYDRPWICFYPSERERDRRSNDNSSTHDRSGNHPREEKGEERQEPNRARKGNRERGYGY